MQSHWTYDYIDLLDGYLHYTRTGHGEKPPLVLVHGFSDNGLCWAKTARKLEYIYDVIMPDSGGHGLSARVQPGDAVDNAGDLAEFTRVLDLQKPIIAGHSMGAASASELSARFSDLPLALILDDPPWGMRRPTQDQREGQNSHSALD